MFIFKYGDNPVDYNEITWDLNANVVFCWTEADPKSIIVIFLMPSVDTDLINISDLTSLKMQTFASLMGETGNRAS